MPVIQTVMGSIGSTNGGALPDPGGWWSFVGGAVNNALKWKTYDSYHNESIDLSLMTILQDSDGVPYLGTGDSNRTYTFTGYVYIPTSGNYIFRTNSDDGSYLWLGQSAWDGNYQINNALINNGGLHGPQIVDSAKINLVGNQWYPIRILFGNLDGGTTLAVYYSSDNGSNFTSPTFAYNSTTPEGFN